MTKGTEDGQAKRRDRAIVRTSVVGILANVFLATFKAAVGLTANSVAIVMDAVNNLSDAASSVITIVGTKLAGREPDQKHPFGYGRVEYLSAMVISLLVLYAGVTALAESVKRILVPEEPDYGAASLAIIAVAVVVKIVLGRYVKGVGERVGSGSLVNSGEDAMLDSAISASTLVAASVFLFFHVSLEPWLGAIIALVIIKSGLEMLQETLSSILGQRADAGLAREIKATVTSYPAVTGAYDLVLHDYGPNAHNGSVHIEVPDTLSADELDKLIRTITVDVAQRHNVILTAIGVYSVNTKDPEAVVARKKVAEIVRDHPDVIQMHGFYLDKDEKTLRFDIVVGFAAEDRNQVYRDIHEKAQREFPGYSLQITLDTDFS